jgi:hypothetical protein
MLGDAPFVIRQDHNTRGLLLEVPTDTTAEVILTAMCSLTEALCDYEFAGRWTMTQFLS